MLESGIILPVTLLPNEKLDLSNFHNGVIASATLYQEVASAGKVEP